MLHSNAWVIIIISCSHFFFFFLLHVRHFNTYSYDDKSIMNIIARYDAKNNKAISSQCKQMNKVYYYNGLLNDTYLKLFELPTGRLPA